MKIGRILYQTFGMVMIAAPQLAYACSVCFGKASPNVIHSLQLAIITLLGALTVVLSGFATLFLQIYKRTKMMSKGSVS